MTLRLKKLTITENGLKHTASIDPMLFLSLEFFDFELQTTPLIQGPESVFEYSTVYDIVISNLFIHYIETEGITIELFEVKGVAYDQKGAANKGKELGSIILPLFPLARNQSIKGTFALMAPDGQVSEATIDLSIYWKYAYTFNDENVEVEEPIPVKFPKWKPVVESPKSEVPSESEKTKTPPKVSSSESSPEIEKYFQSPGHRRPAPQPPIQRQEEELPEPAVPSSVPHLNVPSSSSSIESSSGEDTIIENAHVEEPHFDPDISPPKPPSAPAPAIIESDDSSSDDTYVVDDDDLQDSDLQQKVRETSIDEIPDIPRDDEPAPTLSNRQPQPESTPTPPESEPPLRLPPIAPPRRTTGRLEFKDPLHTSVPPSEESSVAGSISSSPRPRERTIYKSTPDLAARATSSSIKQFEQPQRPDIPHLDCSVTIRLGRLSLVEHSPLLDENFDNLNVFIEWSFLDFSSDLCETPESVPLPRNTWKVETFECERIYELNSRRTALLKQWIDLNTRLSFNLVSDPSDDGGDCDDLGVAQLDLSDVINTSVHSIVCKFYTIMEF
uniref:RPGRIP1 C-terminal domain-containing protein n=1 Tax=Panagrolaimus sp. ES5 TaxID=591445 RepID=A0AC34GQK1_9BILA